MLPSITGHPNTESYQSVTLDEFGLPKGPNSQFWFGSDGEGRDLFVRTMYGTRTSLLVGVVASGIAVLIGLDRRHDRRLLPRVRRLDAVPLR